MFVLMTTVLGEKYREKLLKSKYVGHRKLAMQYPAQKGSAWKNMKRFLCPDHFWVVLFFCQFKLSAATYVSCGCSPGRECVPFEDCLLYSLLFILSGGL